MLQTSFLIPIFKWEAYTIKLQCMIPNVRNVVSHSHYQGRSLTQPKSSARLQMLQTSSLLPISKVGVLPNQTPVQDSKRCKRLFSFPLTRGESYPTKLECMTQNVANTFSRSLLQGGSLTHPNSSARFQMFKRLFLFGIARGESYPPKVQCMTPSVPNVYSHSLYKGGSLTQPNYSA